jgi:LEA14-like dessication related protein
MVALWCLISCCALTAAQAVEPADPVVTIRRIDAIQWQPDGATLDLTLRVENPKGVALPLQALHFRCFFADTAVADGNGLAPVTIPSNGSALVPVRLDVDAVTLAVVSAALSTGQALRYRIEGTAEIGITGIPVPFAHQGTLDLARLSSRPAGS